MPIVKTRIFKNNTCQAIRLSKAIALPESIEEVEIVAIGNCRIITPVGETRDYLV